MTVLARSACRDAVKGKLKAPATAKFSGETTTGSGQSGTYSVAGSVDSENSFGALIRSSFSCEVTFDGGYPSTVQVTSLA